MEMEWETRPLSIAHRPSEWHSNVNGRDPVAGPSSSTITMSGSFARRRSSAATNPPPLGPPPNQPIPNVPPMPDAALAYDSDRQEGPGTNRGASDNQSAGSSDFSQNVINPFHRPGGSARLAAVAAFSQVRQAASFATVPPSSSRTSGNLSDSPPRSLLPQPMRNAPPPTQEIVPDRLLLSPPELKSPAQARPSSRKALTKALELAREAVRLDSTNDDPYGAIMAYGQSVALLSEVMERVMRGEDSTEPNHKRRNGRRRSVVAQEEEVRRLKSIHDTYADRMNILSLIYSIPPMPQSPSAEFVRSVIDPGPSRSSSSNSPTSDSSGQSRSLGSADTDQPDYQSSVEDGGTATIGNATFTIDTSRSSGSGSSSPTIVANTASAGSSSRQYNPVEDVNENQPPSSISLNRTSILPPIRPPPSGPPPARPWGSPAPPPHPTRPIMSPPLTPTIVEPLIRPSSPRRQSHHSAEVSRSRGNSTSHKRTGSGTRLSALQEEALEIVSYPLQARQHNNEVQEAGSSQAGPSYLAPRGHRDTHPLPPIPSPSSSDPGSSITPRMAVPDPSTQGRNSPDTNKPSTYATPRPRGGSTMSSKSDTSTPTLINNSTTMGTISQRRNKTSAPPSVAESLIAEPSSSGVLNVVRLTGTYLPSNTAISLGISGRHRASSQPVRPSPKSSTQIASPEYVTRPTLPLTGSFTSGSQSAGSRKPSSVFRPSPYVLPPQTALHSNSWSQVQAASTAGLVPPAPILPGQLPTTPTSPLPPLPPSDILRKPYHLMNLLCQTMTSKSGGYITRRLHVPFEVWSQGGAKLSNLPEKVRVVEVLCEALQEVQNASVDFCGPMGVSSGLGLGVGSVGRKEGEIWAAKLEEFSAVCDGVVGSFGKKLGVGEGFVVKKSTGVTSWGGKFARQFDKLTNGKNLDSPANYVTGLTRLFQLSQLLDEHTKALSAPIAPTYAALSGDLRSTLELKFKRSSEFFASVVLTFVIRDLSQLLDKYAKKCEKWLAE